MALSDDGSLLGLRSELLVDIKLARLMFGAQKELIVRDEVQFDPKISAMRPIMARLFKQYYWSCPKYCPIRTPRRMEIQMITALNASISAQLPTSNNRSTSARCFQEETTTTWTLPRIVEVAVGLEINSYACAELN
jgi:coenzyme PQQ precursor peptide PqqA